MEGDERTVSRRYAAGEHTVGRLWDATKREVNHARVVFNYDVMVPVVQALNFTRKGWEWTDRTVLWEKAEPAPLLPMSGWARLWAWLTGKKQPQLPAARVVSK